MPQMSPMVWALIPSIMIFLVSLFQVFLPEQMKNKTEISHPIYWLKKSNMHKKW